MVIKVYISGMSGNKEVKKRQQRVTMIMDSKHIEYTVIDITEPGQEAEKDFMQTNAQHKGCTISDPNPRHALPPQLFNDTEYCGDYDDFDMANEVDNLEVFLKLAAPETTEHKNGTATAGDQPTEAAAVEDDENKENKTEDNNTDGGAGEADAAEDGTNEKPETEAVEEKEASAQGSSLADPDGTVADEEKQENTDTTPASVKEADDGNDGTAGLSVDKGIDDEEDNKTDQDEEVAADVSEVSEPTIESSEARLVDASKPEDVYDSISQKKELDEDGEKDENVHGDEGSREDSQTNDVENETEPLQISTDSTTNNDETPKEDTLAENENQEKQEVAAVSMEKDTDSAITNDIQSSSIDEEAMEASNETSEESETSDDEQDSQILNDHDKSSNRVESDEILDKTSVEGEKEERALQRDDSMEVETTPSFDEQKEDDGAKVDNSSSLSEESTVENEENVPRQEEPVTLQASLSVDEETIEDDGSEMDEKSNEPSENGSLQPVELTGSTDKISSTPAPPEDVEESASVVEMDADPDDEEQQLLKTSAALAGKSEDAEEIDIEEEEDDDDAEQPARDGAGEDGISSKLVDTDDPMLAEQEQEE